MRQLLFFILFISLSSLGFAQIQFQHGTLEEAKALAIKQQKPLFVDVYAEWCGPCKYMAKTAFNDSVASHFFNTHFIAVKIDGEKNDGPGVFATYGLTAYPTLLFFYPDGSLARKVVGGQDAANLVAFGKLTLHPENDPVFLARKAYFKSPQLQTDLKLFITELANAKDDSLEYYSAVYFSNYPQLNLKDSTEWLVFLEQVHDYRHPLAQLFLANITTYDRDGSLEKLNLFLQQAFITGTEQHDFSYIETAIRTIFVQLEVLKADGLPDVDTFVTYVRSEYEKAVQSN
jgi:thiol-disulfide isomerase/thioredoxin